MKIVAINGSPRKNGNTAQVLEVVRREVEAAGVEFQVFQPGAKVHPCMACYHCLNTGSLRCVQTDDMVNDIIAACIEADGILLAAPVYHGGISGNMKCVLDRLMLAAGCGVNQLHHKVGGALCTLRRSGGSHRGSLVATRSLPACGGSSHGRSLVATCGSFAAGCGCLGRRSGLGLRLRGHQSLGLRERGLRLGLLDRHLLGAEISGNDDRAVVSPFSRASSSSFWLPTFVQAMGDSSPSSAAVADVMFSTRVSPTFISPCGVSTPSSSDRTANGSPFISIFAIG